MLPILFRFLQKVDKVMQACNRESVLQIFTRVQYNDKNEHDERKKHHVLNSHTLIVSYTPVSRL